MTAYH